MKLHPGIIFTVAVVLTIVAIDIALFRNHVTARLITNIGIVAIYAGFYLRFFKK